MSLKMIAVIVKMKNLYKNRNHNKRNKNHNKRNKKKHNMNIQWNNYNNIIYLHIL